jgi:hypothetical protein
MTKHTKLTIGKRSLRGRSNASVKKHRLVGRKSPSRSSSQQDAKIFAAINRRRRGKSKSISAAARAEGTTLRTIRKRLPGVLIQDRPGGRIRVKATDRYSAKVQVLTNQGALSVTARGSRQRELAGRHRATVLRVLQRKEPQSALEQYRGKKVGGHELISDYALLSSFAQADVVGQLDSLYVSPDASV